MSKMKAELLIIGDDRFDPEALQSAIGLAPDKVCHIGETIGRSIRKYESNIWLIATEYSENTSLLACITPLLKRLEPFWEKLRTAIPRELEVQLSVAAYVCDSAPELNLQKDVIAKLAEIGASLDIDVIISG